MGYSFIVVIEFVIIMPYVLCKDIIKGMPVSLWRKVGNFKPAILGNS